MLGEARRCFLVAVNESGFYYTKDCVEYECNRNQVKRGVAVATNLDLDDKLIEAARKLGGHRTKREAVTRALQEYVQWLKQQAIVSEFGKIEYDRKYDYKKQRKVA